MRARSAAVRKDPVSSTMVRLKRLRDSLPGLFSQIPAGVWHRLVGTKVLLPYYHIVGDEPVAHVKHLYRFRSVAEFTADLDWLLSQFTSISHDELLANRRTGAPLPKNPFHLTFDDGFRETADCIAPILRAKGVHATFFLSSGFIDNQRLCHNEKTSLLMEHLHTRTAGQQLDKIEALLDAHGIPAGTLSARFLSVQYPEREVLDEIARVIDCDFDHYLQAAKPYLSSDQVRGLLRDGFSIGAHGVDHPRFATLSLDQQLQQTQQSVDFLRQKFDLGEISFAFPHTETGVSKIFFERATREANVTAFFGTRGMMDDEISNLLQRFSMEKTSQPADWIVSKQYARRCAQLLTGQSVVRRRSQESMEASKLPV